MIDPSTLESDVLVPTDPFASSAAVTTNAGYNSATLLVWLRL
jgi:hypothetical protein